jgi:hypothetical protein
MRSLLWLVPGERIIDEYAVATGQHPWITGQITDRGGSHHPYSSRRCLRQHLLEITASRRPGRPQTQIDPLHFTGDGMVECRQ